MRCKDCKYFRIKTEDTYGNCTNENITNDYEITGGYDKWDTAYKKDDMLVAWMCDDPYVGVCLQVGKNFGCIHFEEKKENEEG